MKNLHFKTNTLYNTLKITVRSISYKPVKIWGNTRHFPPAIKEWPDSSYSFNKNYEKQVINKRNTVNNLINSYFNFYTKKQSIRSKKIRVLMKRKSLNKFLTSKPEIKHNNDKVIVNLFAYDKISKSSIRNIYTNNTDLNFFNNWLKKQLFSKGRDNINKLCKIRGEVSRDEVFKNIKNKYETDIKLPYLYSHFNESKKIDVIYKYIKENKSIKIYKIYKKYKKLQNLSFKKFLHLIVLRKQKRIKFPFRKLRNENSILMLRSTNLKNNNLKYLQKLFVFYFLTCILYVFNIKVKTSYTGNKILLTFIYDNNKIITYKGDNIKNTYFLDKVNIAMWSTILAILKQTSIINVHVKLTQLFKYFYQKYYTKLFSKILKYNILNNINYFNLILNKYKSGRFIYFLKNIVYNIYNKKVEINIVNLKYPQLNSDIITNIMTRKLKRKKGKYLNVLGKSLILTKLPLKIFNKENVPSTSKLVDLDYHKSSNNEGIINLFKDFVSKIYPTDLIKKEHKTLEYGKVKYTKSTGKIGNILNNIKYKWVTGIRLETAGRLTRRFTAARSIFKYKYRGNLKNVDFFFLNGVNKSMSTVLLRNYVKANSQYTQQSSRKRIGAFNIKTWISSY